MQNIQRVGLVLSCWLVLGTFAAFGQQDGPASVDLKAQDLPGSNGLEGYKPIWVSFGSSFSQRESDWKDKVEYKKESGSPQTSVDGLPFTLEIGVNAMKYLDLSFDYYQSSKFSVQGSKGDSFSYLQGKIKNTDVKVRDTYSFSSSKKVTVYQYTGYGFNILGAVTLSKFRLYGGLALATMDVKSDVYKQETITLRIPTLGVGYFIGDFFLFLNLSDYNGLGARYYF